MTGRPSIVKRLYDGVALFALLNLLGLAGLTAFLVSRGGITGEKLRGVAAVLRGDESSPATPDGFEELVETAADSAGGGTAGAIPNTDRDVQIMRLEGERIKAELDQRLALNNSILLRVLAERERFQREKELANRQQQQQLVERQSEGFTRQIEIYNALKPKIALEHLLAMPDPNESARILLEMDTRKAKKIVETAKGGDQMQKMKTVLQRVREVRPERFDDLGSGP